MEARHIQRLESAIDGIAAAVLAAAVGYAALRLGVAPAAAAAAAALTLFGCWRILAAVATASPTFVIRPFDAVALPEADGADELILTDADRVDRHAEPGELVLDDVLARLEDFSRVVRLFDRSAMPTPGELASRIDRHLEAPRPAAPDASQALHDALSELRRSLR